MVTLYYLRRFLSFFQDIISDATDSEVAVSEELKAFFNGVHQTLKENKSLLGQSISDVNRKKILDGVAIPGSDYRTLIYDKAFSGNKATLSLKSIEDFLLTTLKYLDHTIDANKRSDNLYHAYNLMTLNDDNSISISYLDEMLEGQVSALSSGYLSSEECLKLLDALKSSKLFREDQYSYLLYPNKELTGFLKKNDIPKSAVESSELLQKMIEDGNSRIIEKDINGNYHFNGNFNNANSLKTVLTELKETKYSNLAKKESKQLLQTFEKVFNHKAFTGRSGTFFGYEGLGSIYWHMVSKLQLAVMECCLKAIEEKQSDEIVGRLLEHYYEINEGIGVHKSPTLYGAFPTDPYSHTPAGKGAQQPGMTGQVKEDILSRIGELGVFVKQGKLTFNPGLLRVDEFLKDSKIYHFIDVHKNSRQIKLSENSLAFSYCQIPIVYKLTNDIGIEIKFTNGQHKSINSLELDSEISSKIFSRNGEIEQITVSLTKNICN
jgi:hypothetical protein